MNETYVTVAGNVATELRHRQTDSGVDVVSFRVATAARRFDKGTRTWGDGPTSYYTVNCWRWLAENVLASVHKGDPVVVAGRQRVRDWEKAGRTGTSVEIDADVVGPDLAWGQARFTRVVRTRVITAEEKRSDEAAAAFGVPPVGVDPETGEVYDEASEDEGQVA